MSEETPKPVNPISPPPAKGAPAVKEKKWWPTIIGLVVVLGIGFLLFRIITNQPKAAPPTPLVQVSTVAAQQGDMGIYLEALLGEVTPLATVAVPSQVSGQLLKVNFVEGQTVRPGDILAEIDARPFQAQLDSAAGQLQRDNALLAEAKMDMSRYQAAYEQKAIPKQQLDDQTALVEQDTGTVKYDQGQVESARVQLGYCHITNTVAGRVGLRLVDAGNIVQPSSTNGIVVVTQLQPITVIFSVAEDYLPAIQRQLAMSNHMVVQAFDRAQETNLATGSVLALDNQIDANTGTVRVKAIFTNDDNALFPNQFVNIRLLIDTLHGQTLIPVSVIQRNGTATFVYILNEDETVTMRAVKVGATDGNSAAVEGVNPGEVLAADNFNRLQDSAKVRQRQANPANARGQQ
jgi:multidrug efflux system membrane fusion protein